MPRVVTVLANLLVIVPLAPAQQSPLAAADALATIRVDAGLRVELVASEPQIESPVAMAFDENGVLFVVEMRDYPNGPAPGAPPAGRIKRLEDRNGDGFFETSAVFADGLLFANGLLPWNGGLIVTAAPSIFFLKDTDDDGIADQRDVWWEGFAAENPQLRVSHPILGLDGWVYVANGLRGGKIKRHGAPESDAIDLSGRDFKFDPQTLKGEAISGMGQFGNTFDDWGRRFVCTNRNHIIPIIFEEKYAKRNPYLIVPPPLTDDQTAGGAARIFPISKNFTTSTLHEGSFSAACGITIYRGDALGPNYYGCAFTCDPTGNLVHQEAIEPDGAGFKWHPPKEGVEFLASTDDWFRPVSLAHGPDGAPYVVDMYRAVIEHPEWMPPELRNRPDLQLGRDMGRIWRIVPETSNTENRRTRLDARTTPELVAALDHPNSWHRMTAQRLLLERGDRDAVESLKRLLSSDKRDIARIHAAYLLDSFAALDEEATLALSVDRSARLREPAAQFLERSANESERANGALVELARDEDARVRYQAALSIGAWRPADVIMREFKGLVLKTLLKRAPADRWNRLAVLSASDDVLGQLIGTMGIPPGIGDFNTPGVMETWSAVVRQAGAAESLEPAHDLFFLLEGVDDEPESARVSTLLLAALEEGLRLRGRTIVDLKADLAREKSRNADRSTQVLQRLLDAMPARARDSRLSLDTRVAALRLAAANPQGDANDLLLSLLREGEPLELQVAAAASLHGKPRGPDAAALIVAFPGASPTLQRSLIAALLSTDESTKAALAAVESGALADTAFDAQQAARLIADARPEIREAARVLERRLPSDRATVLSEYSRALALPGDVGRGRTIFRERCAQCHRVETFGTAVGPDISDLRTKTPEMLLHDILNPNAAIDANYQVYSVALKDGRVLSGIIAAESATGLTVRRADADSDTVLRSEIVELRSTGQSLMPDGVEKDIPVEAMADLIDYLKKWRYQAAGVPARAGIRP